MYFPTTLVALVPLAVFSAIEAAPIAEPPQFSGNLNSRTMGFRLAGNEIAESIFRRDSEARQILSNYLGISNSSFNTLTSGADAQLGYAHMNAVHNPGTEPRVCAIFARSSNEWRNEITKVFIPDMLVGDAGDKKRRAEHEAHRASYLKHIVPNVPTQNIVKISRLDKTRPSTSY
ncbi:hypothetical protein FOMPIDRAFT_117535 [Fomitopsis schrenkii]|uniref:Uncharacterized protein n=1 Tax=Fomitopsis schrenkii TaxID=2126942 RepID=S8DNC8_FOMSC|nr:hypothetical protein FOMPIDRAFT_117535 [Fomitopsis schrenkii]